MHAHRLVCRPLRGAVHPVPVCLPGGERLPLGHEAHGRPPEGGGDGGGVAQAEAADEQRAVLGDGCTQRVAVGRPRLGSPLGVVRNRAGRPGSRCTSSAEVGGDDMSSPFGVRRWSAVGDGHTTRAASPGVCAGSSGHRRGARAGPRARRAPPTRVPSYSVESGGQAVGRNGHWHGQSLRGRGVKDVREVAVCGAAVVPISAPTCSRAARRDRRSRRLRQPCAISPLVRADRSRGARHR